MKTHLSDRFSEAIRQALQDMKDREGDPRYRIDMGYWHQREVFGVRQCAICLAGAVMSKHLSADQHALPTQFDDFLKLGALDSLRYGHLLTAARQWSDATKEDREVLRAAISNHSTLPPRSYSTNREGFYQDMEAYAAMFEKVGL